MRKQGEEKKRRRLSVDKTNVREPANEWPKADMVLVEWRDSTGSHGWFEKDEDFSADGLRCRSIGWLVDVSDLRLVLAQNINDDNQHGERLYIPSAVVISITKLRKGVKLERVKGKRKGKHEFSERS